MERVSDFDIYCGHYLKIDIYYKIINANYTSSPGAIHCALTQIAIVKFCYI